MTHTHINPWAQLDHKPKAARPKARHPGESKGIQGTSSTKAFGSQSTWPVMVFASRNPRPNHQRASATSLCLRISELCDVFKPVYDSVEKTSGTPEAPECPGCCPACFSGWGSTHGLELPATKLTIPHRPTSSQGQGALIVPSLFAIAKVQQSRPSQHGTTLTKPKQSYH